MSKKLRNMTQEEKEADLKRPRLIDWKALDDRVLAVAKEGWGGDWACYIGPVPGNNHEREAQDVIDHGTKASQELAEFLFPEWEKSCLYYRW